MNTHEFLRDQIDRQLQSDGFSSAVSFTVANEALEFFKRTAHFKKGALAECLAFAKKRAKELSASNKGRNRA